MKNILLVSILLFVSISLYAQEGQIKGRVYHKLNNEPIGFASVLIQSTNKGTTTDENGNYTITGLTPGQYNIEASFVGFKKLVVFEIQVTNARPAIVDFALEQENQQLQEVEILSTQTFYKPDESPLSLRTIGPTEIKQTPGGNRDISKVVRSLPGVASPPSFRNDIIIRGGAPSENTFYLDGIQIPVINHFQTQGSSGGPVGMINVDLLNEVNFYSGAFPANRNNTLSSVFDFTLKEGRKDKWIVNGVVGASDLGITTEGPVTENSSLVISARRSYLKFLFNIFNLPFLPVYNDVQFKYSVKLNDKSKLTVLGIGAVDDFTLNLDAPQQASTIEEKEEAEYILNILPVSTQWNYTTGIKYDLFNQNSTTSFILSTNTLNNKSIKYAGNNDSSVENLIQDYESTESEWKFRIEDYRVQGKIKLNYGINGEYARLNTDEFTRLVTQAGAVTRNYNTNLSFYKWGLFLQSSTTVLNDKLTLSLGVRSDANDYSGDMNDLTKQISPRFSASYSISNSVSANFNTGIYYQLPSYTVLGFRDAVNGELINKENGVTYIRSKHLVGGLEFYLKQNARITAEGFYKLYDRYPFLIEDSISLANLGADFGIIGNAPINSTSEGRSYGAEFLFQQKLFKGYYGLLSYTWVRSEFKDKNERYVPTSWDNRHLVSLTGGKKFKSNWEIGLRWLFTGAAPYTPYNLDQTLRVENWNVRPFGIPDYDYLNSERSSAFHQLDVRIDKKYFFRKWSIDLYLDIQNLYNYVVEFQDNIDVVKDQNGKPVPDPQNPSYYLPKYIQNTYGSILPTIGVIIEL